MLASCKDIAFHNKNIPLNKSLSSKLTTILFLVGRMVEITIRITFCIVLELSHPIDTHL